LAGELCRADGAGSRIAVSGTEWHEADGVEELADAARAIGCGGVEFWYPKNGVRDGADRAAAAVLDAGLEIHCVATPAQLLADGLPQSERLVMEAIGFARRFGSPRVNLYFGHAAIRDDARAIQAAARTLAPILETAAAAGVTITLENEFDAFGWDPAGSDITRRPASLRALCELVDSPWFGLTLDPANFVCAGVEDPGLVAGLAEHVCHVHVKDVVRASADRPVRPGWVRYRDHERLFDTAPLGRGIVDWPAIAAGLVSAGYGGSFALEPHCTRDHLLAELLHAAGFIRGLIDESGQRSPSAPDLG
jgi:sugar phosphate isomerase/epimerase